MKIKKKEEETLNEKQLIKKCQQGEKSAFEEIIRMYYPYVSGFLLKASGNITLSEDLTQDTFLKMIRNIEKYEINGNACFGTWIVAIAKNCYIDYLRHNHVYIDNIDDLQIDSNSDISNEICNKLQYEEALQAIEQLPPEQGIAIRLKYEESMTLDEIAKQFGVPSKTIKSRIHDGTEKLRKKLNYHERMINI